MRLFNQSFAALRLKWSLSLIFLRYFIDTPNAVAFLLKQKVHSLAGLPSFPCEMDAGDVELRHTFR